MVPLGAIFNKVILIKSAGVLMSSLGAFFFFDKFQAVGLSGALIPTALLSLGLIVVGQFIFWRI